MSKVEQTRTRAAELPHDDVIGVLLEQHARIEELFSAIETAHGTVRQALFQELRALLVVHETAEELVLRPLTRDAGAGDVADTRNEEEKDAIELLKRLEQLDVAGVDFSTEFSALGKGVLEHANREETEEFPVILRAYDEPRRVQLGKELLRVSSLAPTHAHPATTGSTAKQLFAAPIQSIVDRVRDAMPR